MACSCKTGRGESLDKAVPHEVRPHESCIFCALKHVSSAYASLMTGPLTSNIIGDLELARRHTLKDYPEIARQLARMVFAACTRDVDYMRSNIQKVLDDIDETAMSTSPDGEQEDEPVATVVGDSTDRHISDASNPFIGELHFMAAYRLAFEVGYMRPNKYMIIGDLALAQEHLVHHVYTAAKELRDLRHRVQLVQSTDTDTYWTDMATAVGTYVEGDLQEHVRMYSDGLRAYLGLDKED